MGAGAESSSSMAAMVAVHFATTGRSHRGAGATAKRILNESWDDIVRLARLLAEGRTLSRAEIEAELEAEVSGSASSRTLSETAGSTRRD